MKKFFRGLIISLVVLIVLPIALVFIFFFDTGKMKVTYDDTFKKEDFSKALVVDSLDYAPDNKLLKFKVSEADINNFIHSALKDNAQINKYLTQLAIDVQDDAYVLNVSGKFSFFETRARLTAKLSKENIKNEGGVEQPAFVLSVEKMSLGRLTRLKNVITFVLNRFIDNTTLDALTSSLKLHADLNNSRFYIYTADLRQMINDAMGSGGGAGEQQFYFAFINDFLDKNLINIDFYGDESLSVNVNLEPLTGNDYDSTAGNNVYYPMEYNNTTTYLTINGESKKLSLDTIREGLVYLLDNNLITANDINAVSNYLFNGYKPGNAPECDLTGLGIANKESYVGFNLVPASSIDDTIKNGISSYEGYDISINSFDIANISESDVNLFLKTQGIFGNKFLLQRELKDHKNKVNYIALDNAYINYYDKNAVLSVGLNINGLETHITLKLALDETNNDSKKLVYKPTTVYFGKECDNMQLSEDSEKVIFDTMYAAVNQDSFKFDRNGNLTIDFTSLIDQGINSINTGDPIKDAAFKAFLQSAETTISLKVEGESITDNSNIKIQAVRN